MTHAHDDIRVGNLCLPFIDNGWLMPWGEVVSNPLKAQRLAEEYRERQEGNDASSLLQRNRPVRCAMAA